MAEWPRFPFSELLATPLRNGVYKPKEFHGRGSKIVNMGELFAHPRLEAVEMRRLEMTSEELHKSDVRRGDLLVARRSLVADGAGKCCVVVDVDEPTTFESSLIRARLDPRRADPMFMFYFFSSPMGRHALGTIRRQVAVAGITGTDLSALVVPVPVLDEQRVIARVLGSLDDKIELNRRINETLEAMARASYKSWFVDFEPVRAKMRGEQPAGLDAATAALFPSQLVQTQDGDVPRGWIVGSIANLASCRRETVAPSAVPPSTPYVGLEHFERGRIFLEKIGLPDDLESLKARFARGDVLFGKLRPYFKKVALSTCEGICSTDVLVLRPRSGMRAIALLLAASKPFIDHAVALSDGTRMPRTSWEQVCRYPFAVPPDDVASAFDRICAPLFARAESGGRESLTLGQLRDALLPRLLSGELRVRDAERVVEDAA